MFSGILVSFILLLELIFSFSNLDIIYSVSNKSDSQASNTHAIGKVLYTEYFLPFQIAGCVLLVAMLGAIILTLKKRRGAQANIAEQVSRSKEDSLELIKLEKSNMQLDPSYFTILSAILFCTGLLGIFLNRRSIILILMSIEILLLAVNINLLAFLSFHGNLPRTNIYNVCINGYSC